MKSYEDRIFQCTVSSPALFLVEKLFVQKKIVNKKYVWTLGRRNKCAFDGKGQIKKEFILVFYAGAEASRVFRMQASNKDSLHHQMLCPVSLFCIAVLSL